MVRNPLLLGVVPFLVFTSLACRVPREQPLVPQAEYVLDPSGTRLLEGHARDDLTRVRAVIGERHTVDWEGWLAERFSCVDEGERGLWEELELQGPSPPNFKMLELSRGGFLFRSDRGVLHYEKRRSRFFDAYKQHLSWRSTDARNRWRRRVPFIQLPVYPFVVGDWVMYLSGRGAARLLLIISLRSGRTLLEYDVTQYGYEFYQPQLPMHGYYSDGFLVVQPATREYVEKGQPSYVKWGNIRVLKLPEQEPQTTRSRQASRPQ